MSLAQAVAAVVVTVKGNAYGCESAIGKSSMTNERDFLQSYDPADWSGPFLRLGEGIFDFSIKTRTPPGYRNPP